MMYQGLTRKRSKNEENKNIFCLSRSKHDFSSYFSANLNKRSEWSNHLIYVEAGNLTFEFGQKMGIF